MFPASIVNLNKGEGMLRGSISLSPDQMRIEMAKEQSILREGRKFISLMLINPNMNRIQGAIVLHATPYMDTMTNLTKFHFEERGGPMLFNEGMDGGMHCNILDCEHNRNFLASMYYANYWIIEDKIVDQEIKCLASGIKDRAIIDVTGNQAAETILSDDELEARAAKLNAELANRKLAKSDMKMKKPVRKIIDASAEFAAKRDENIEQENAIEQQKQEPLSIDTQRDPIPAIETEIPPETIVPKSVRGRRKSSLVNIE